MSLSDIVQREWDAVGSGDFDTLVTDYVDDMLFVMLGQADVLEGREAFRAALDGLGGFFRQDLKLQVFARSKKVPKSFRLSNGSQRK